MKTLIIVNPCSGKYNSKKINKVSEILKTKCESVSIQHTTRPFEATSIASDTDAQLVIAAGGDGIINEVAKGLIGSNKLFAILPFGTANVFAREHDIHLNPIKAAKNLNFENKIKINIGYFDDKIFLLMVGFGFDAEVVSRIENMKKKYINKKILYVLAGFITLLKNKFNPFMISYDKTSKNIHHSIISIVSSYAGKYKLGKVNNNKLNIFSISTNSRFSIIKSIISMFFGFGFSRKNSAVDYVKINGVKFCQIDGEYVEINKSSFFIQINKDALTLIK